MKNCLIIGRTNVGKTLFFFNFAEYLGLKKVEVYNQMPDGTSTQQKLLVNDARHEFSGLGQHKTRTLQSIELELPLGKGKRQFLLTDSTGLTDGIHSDHEIRHAMAQTLQEMRVADMILHMVDLSQIGKDQERWQQSALDSQLMEFGKYKGGYVILGNKIDLPDAKKGLAFLKDLIQDVRIIPMSALYRQGFREVKEHVWRMV